MKCMLTLDSRTTVAEEQIIDVHGNDQSEQGSSDQFFCPIMSTLTISSQYKQNTHSVSLKYEQQHVTISYICMVHNGVNSNDYGKLA